MSGRLVKAQNVRELKRVYGEYRTIKEKNETSGNFMRTSPVRNLRC